MNVLLTSSGRRVALVRAFRQALDDLHPRLPHLVEVYRMHVPVISMRERAHDLLEALSFRYDRLALSNLRPWRDAAGDARPKLRVQRFRALLEIV